MKFRKKQIVIEAIQWGGDNLDEIALFINKPISLDIESKFKIATLEGEMTASLGDWIIKDIKDEFYPCKPDIFEKTYDVI